MRSERQAPSAGTTCSAAGKERRLLHSRSTPGPTFGLPWRFAPRLVERILRHGRPVAVALEEPEPSGNVKRRRLAYLFEPVARAEPIPNQHTSKEHTP